MDHSSIADIIAAARIAAANAHPPQSLETEPRFPGEDGGQSLANIAQRDLDAALQLLAERAQYITGASGAAIALRRGEHADMLCRASSGPNAPELGALLSMEYGLSGESVRTRQVLRCDDTETDPRVNREGCRRLGIASVVVMPIVSEQRVLGVFELFSGKPHAFEERDLSALQRLGEMVETAVKHAEAAQRLPGVLESGVDAPLSDAVVTETLPVKSARVATGADLATVVPEEETPLREPEKAVLEKTELEPELVPKRPLFWSATEQVQPNVGQAAAAGESIPVPAQLRNLQKCKACGFPVSQERTFCVECEEKQWRGQRVP
jgi:signal transduction protein with GAF and PtsI domain